MSKIKMRLRDKDPIKMTVKNAVKKMYPQLENLNVVPSGEVQTFKSEDYYGYNEVTVQDVKLQNKELTLNKNGIYTIVADDNYTGLNEVEVTLDAIEDLEEELTEYNEELTTQETTVDELIELLKTKGIGEKEKYSPKRISFIYYNGTDLSYELENLDTSKIEDMKQMFEQCKNVLALNTSHFDTSKVTNMREMFSGCYKSEIIDVSNFDTSNVEDFDYMFEDCEKVKVLDVSNFDISKTTSLSYMFDGCLSVENLDVSKWDTSKITKMNYLFGSCIKVMNYNLSNFDTSNVTEMRGMFWNFKGTDLDMSNFDASKVTAIPSFFGYAYFLKNLKFMKNLGKGYTQKTDNASNYKLDFSQMYSLTRESVLDIFNNLYDLNLTYDVANGGTLYTQQINLHDTTITLLTVEDIAIATSKGWTVV